MSPATTDETFASLDNGSIDAALENWPSSHAKDYVALVTKKKSVVNLGKSPSANSTW